MSLILKGNECVIYKNPKDGLFVMFYRHDDQDPGIIWETWSRYPDLEHISPNSSTEVNIKDVDITNLQFISKETW